MLEAAILRHAAKKVERAIEADFTKLMGARVGQAAGTARGVVRAVTVRRRRFFPGLPKSLFDRLPQLVARLPSSMRRTRDPAVPPAAKAARRALTVDLCNEHLLPAGGEGGGGKYLGGLLQLPPARGCAADADAQPQPEVVLPGFRPGPVDATQVSCSCAAAVAAVLVATVLVAVPSPPSDMLAGSPTTPRGPQLAWARPSVRLRDGTTAQAVLCLRWYTKNREHQQPWHLVCLPHLPLDLPSSSSSAAATEAAARSGARAYAVPHTPDQAVLERWAEHATNLGCYPLREVATADKAVLVPMHLVAGRVTVVPVLPQHEHCTHLQEARTRPLVFLLDELH